MLLFVLLLLFPFGNFGAVYRRNNVCATFEDYYNLDESSNCWYNPDVDAETVPGIITGHGYPLQTHKAVTEDGYILTVYRIPSKPDPKGVVFLHHGMGGDSVTWVIAGNHSLAFLLWEDGYDVWMANARGTRDSLGHVSLDPSMERYWNFSFHEIGRYDLQAELELVALETGRNDIAYVGHSMGSTAALIYASTRPEEARSLVKVFVAMAPAALYESYKAPAKPFVWLIRLGLEILGLLGVYAVHPDLAAVRALKMFCGANIVNPETCYDLLQSLTGPNPAEYNPPWAPLFLAQFPQAVASKILLHYMQLIRAKDRFQAYDYGPSANLRSYGTRLPPKYPLGDVKVPFYIIYGKQDQGVTPEGVLKLYAELPEEAKVYGIRGVDIGHMDFVLGRNMKRKIYDPLLEFLDRVFRLKRRASLDTPS